MAEFVLLGGTANFFSIYNAVVTARILLSWCLLPLSFLTRATRFPQAMTVSFLQPIFIVTEPFLALFRGLIPPIGGLDLSLIPALLLLQAAGGAVGALGADMSLLQQ